MRSFLFAICFFLLLGIFGSCPLARALPNQPVLISPGSNAVNVGTVHLSVSVSSPVGSSLTVKYYSRLVATSPYPPEFNIIALPDTQYYVATESNALPSMFFAQTDWILSNRGRSNIVYVAQLGDCVDHGDTNGGTPINEWNNATNALYRLENPVTTQLSNGIPYGVAVGNHDQSPNGDATGTTTFYNQFFGTNHFASYGYYGGHYGTNNNNHFDLFSASGLDFITVYFEYDTNATIAVLNWADALLTTYSNRNAIIVSHYIGNPTTPSTFGAQGAAIYNTLKGHTNIFLMLSGHVNGEGSRSDTYKNHTITTLVSDYQFRTNGGSGWMRIMHFIPASNVIQVLTYTPYYNQYESDFDSQLTVPFNMANASGASTNIITTFAAIATNLNQSSGSTSTFTWAAVQTNSSYQWYVTVSDGANTVIGPTWTFSTGSGNVPPVASNLAFTLPADSATNLNLAASDANGDPLTYYLNSLPAHGRISNFNSATGALNFIPAHAFTGNDGFTYFAYDGTAYSGLASVSITVTTLADTNGNGIPDIWENRYSLTNTLGAADPDGDGFSNYQEYIANTNPTNAASALRLLSATVDGAGHATIVWSSVGGVRYRVQYSDSLASGSFLDIIRPAAAEMDPAAAGAASTQTFTDDFSLTGQPPALGRRLYRIAVVQ